MAGLDVSYEYRPKDWAEMRIFSSVPGCIESLALLCEKIIWHEVAKKSVAAEGRQLTIHFNRDQVPQWCIDKMNEDLSANGGVAHATVFQSAAR